MPVHCGWTPWPNHDGVDLSVIDTTSHFLLAAIAKDEIVKIAIANIIAVIFAIFHL